MKVPVLIFDNVLAIPVVILQCALLGLIFFITTQPWLDFHPTDTTAMMFCGSHKSLTLGKIMLLFTDIDICQHVCINFYKLFPPQYGKFDSFQLMFLNFDHLLWMKCYNSLPIEIELKLNFFIPNWYSCSVYGELTQALAYTCSLKY